MKSLNLSELRAALARRGWPQWRLAMRLGVGPTTLCEWLAGHHLPTDDLRERIERILKLSPGTLKIERRVLPDAAPKGDGDGTTDPKP